MFPGLFQSKCDTSPPDKTPSDINLPIGVILKISVGTNVYIYIYILSVIENPLSPVF